MKKLAIMLFLVTALPSSARAGEITTGSSFGPYQTGSGGEFTLVNVTGFDTSAYGTGAKGFLASDSFQTFCLENSTPPEYIYLNTTYNGVLSNKAVNGGVGSGGDVISRGTGWLYSQFATGNWEGSLTYDYSTSAGRKASAAALQAAFWWLEGEGGVAFDTGNIYMVAADMKFGGLSQWDGVGNNYGVRAINLTDKATGGLRQDQLFYVPDGGTTLMLLGGALMGMGALRRTFRL